VWSQPGCVGYRDVSGRS